MAGKRTVVYGVGINDADYLTSPIINGKNKTCKFYKTWQGMLERCYSARLKERYPTYAGCSVEKDWLLFSNFKKWMEKQDWHGKQLDKDLLFVGNKIYSQNTCVFVGALTNTFTIDRSLDRGCYALGVRLAKRASRFEARCNNPFTKKSESLGFFLSEAEAHISWRRRKHELACKLAELQADDRVAKALRERYL